MSAIVISGNKRSFFQDSQPTSPASPSTPSSSSKKLRCTSSHFSPPTPTSSHFNPFTSSPPLHHLFPATNNQVLEEMREENGNDLDVAIKLLRELQLGSSEGDFNIEVETEHPFDVPGVGVVAPLDNLSSQDNLPKDGSEWVELLVREMSNASNIDDAKLRASRILELLETVIRSRADADAEQNFQMENRILKEQIDALIRLNAVLKRAVAIQHERQKDYDEQSNELQHLKQLVSQFRERLKALEVNNYALAVHLKQAQPCISSIPGRFHPDIF